MRLLQWTVTTTLFIAEACMCSGSALLHMPSLRRRDDLDAVAWKASSHFEGELERRSPQQSPSNSNLNLTASDAGRNVSTLEACQNSMQNMSSVSNDAGFAACYNILDWNPDMGGMFQADLRLYEFSQATGQFAGVPMDAITIQLKYPNSTQFSILMNKKRSLASLARRQSSDVSQDADWQFSLVGNFKMQLNSKVLNSTELMSLLIPQITLQADTNGTTAEATLKPSDVVYFVVGQFSNETTPQLVSQATDPVMAAAAIKASTPFVLPGRTFGIFPIGLIVTSSWTVLFLLAFGLGTLGRMRHRDIFRKRVAATVRFGKK